MANPTALTGVPAVLEATTTAAQVTLDKAREYTIYHNGLDTSLAAVTTPIIFSFVATVVADGNEGADKAILIDGGAPMVIGPGVSVLKFDTSSGSPTMTIIPSPKHADKWWSSED